GSTKPAPTGSTMATNTIGKVRLICCNAATLGAPAAMTTSGASATNSAAYLRELAIKYRLPGMYPFKENVEAGGLMRYGADRDDLYRRAATYIDRILKGAKPPDLPVEQASKYQFVINLRTAKALGVLIPPSLLARADKVIE